MCHKSGVQALTKGKGLWGNANASGVRGAPKCRGTWGMGIHPSHWHPPLHAHVYVRTGVRYVAMSCGLLGPRVPTLSNVIIL